MCNLDIVKRKALEKLEELLKGVLDYYNTTKDIHDLSINIPKGYFSDKEYKEVKRNIDDINSSPCKFLAYCKYSGVEIPQTLQEFVIEDYENDIKTSR